MCRRTSAFTCDCGTMADPATTPQGIYRAQVAAGILVDDPAQADAVRHLQRLYEDLIAAPRTRRGIRAWLQRGRPLKPVTGLYLWGGVGRGKTCLVDDFYDCLPFPEKRRTHFHRFMNSTHHRLKELRDRIDPLSIVAAQMASQTRVLCFDEFVVNDIADAMILAGLLRHLFENGVTLVATSNTAPDDLYLEGLQRDRFLPAIELLKMHTRILPIDGETDYRLQFLDRAEIYFCPLDNEARTGLAHNFRNIAGGPGHTGAHLEIDGREIPTVRLANGIAWLTFDVLCGSPRAPSDYLEIARCYHSLLLSDVPQMDDERDDEARRLINLVDVMYDRNVKLIMSAATAPEHLYVGTRLAQDFRRTRSRLAEMQSREYLARKHLP